MKFSKIKTIAMSLLLMSAAGTTYAVDIPLADGEYIVLSDGMQSGCNLEGNPSYNVGSTGDNSSVTIPVHNATQQSMMFSMKVGNKDTDDQLKVTLTDKNTCVKYLDKIFTIENTNNWTPTMEHKFMIPNLPAGDYTLRVETYYNNSSNKYCGNWGYFTFNAISQMASIPGDIAIKEWSVSGLRIDSETGELSYIKNGCYAQASPVEATEAGVYQVSLPISVYDTGNIHLTIFDENGNIEVDCITPVDNTCSMSSPQTWILDDEISTGTKTIRLGFESTHTGYIANTMLPTFTKVADHIAKVKAFDISGLDVNSHETYDWSVDLPVGYAGETVTFSVEKQYGSVSVTAANGQTTVEVTDNGNGTYTIPTPAPNTETILTISLAKDHDENIIIGKDTYTARIFNIGTISLTGITLDNHEVEASVIEDINEDGTAAIEDYVFTTVPVLAATLIDGSNVTATGSVSGGTITYNFNGAIGALSRDFTLSAKTLHSYTPTADDESIEVKYAASSGENWTNGLYTIIGVNDGYQTSFKMGRGEKTLVIPSDIKVKQIIFHDLRNNYAGNEACITNVYSGDATVWTPTINEFYYGNVRIIDLTCNIENHEAGTPICFTFQGGGQMMCWIELIAEKVVLNTSPEVSSYEVVAPEGANHFVLAVTFDREISAAEATLGETHVEADGGSSTVYFPFWNLDNDTEYTVTIPAGGVTDTYGNTNTEDIVFTASTSAKASVTRTTDNLYVVSNVDEWRTALAAVNASNKNAGASRAVIFVLNGDYDFGSEEQTFRCHNVSVIGQSRSGVILHGNRTGISNPVISTRYSNGMYLQDLTIRNDLDFGKARVGVGVALYSGNREVGVNLSLESQQDTQVTGDQGYYRDCDIYGVVDFICGAGDNYYDHCNLIMTGSGAITAPMTSSSQRWGYVFQGCTIKEVAGANSTGYTLGRPWQNEPRCYYLNTKMEVLPADNGWGSMGNLPTHFYEYKSVNASGNLLDLSGRKNSSTHTGASYTPILTDAQASAFTLHNVLGSKDSYLPTDLIETLPAPAVKIEDGNIVWNHVDGARFYVVMKDGKYVASTSEATYKPTTAGEYTVMAASQTGVPGLVSDKVQSLGTSAAEMIESDVDGTLYYDLQGRRVDHPTKGIYISNGRKVIIK